MWKAAHQELNMLGFKADKFLHHVEIKITIQFCNINLRTSGSF